MQGNLDYEFRSLIFTLAYDIHDIVAPREQSDPLYHITETYSVTVILAGIRRYTLASGGPYCDCGYKKKAKAVSQ